MLLFYAFYELYRICSGGSTLCQNFAMSVINSERDIDIAFLAVLAMMGLRFIKLSGLAQVVWGGGWFVTMGRQARHRYWQNSC